MKKLGFTLAELVVTLGLIAVIAVMVVPAVGHIMPDRNKAKLLKYRAKIENITNELLNNDKIFYSVDIKNNETGAEEPDGEPDCYGLDCTGQPLVEPYNTVEYATEYKYWLLLRTKLALNIDNCTADGIQINDIKSSDYHELTLDLDKASSLDCTYDSIDCPKPDRFILKVDKYGNIKPGDALTDAYFRNPLSLNDMKKDFKKAEELFATETY